MLILMDWDIVLGIHEMSMPSLKYSYTLHAKCGVSKPVIIIDSCVVESECVTQSIYAKQIVFCIVFCIWMISSNIYIFTWKQHSMSTCRQNKHTQRHLVEAEDAISKCENCGCHSSTSNIVHCKIRKSYALLKYFGLKTYQNEYQMEIPLLITQPFHQCDGTTVYSCRAQQIIIYTNPCCHQEESKCPDQDHVKMAVINMWHSQFLTESFDCFNVRVVPHSIMLCDLPGAEEIHNRENSISWNGLIR